MSKDLLFDLFNIDKSSPEVNNIGNDLLCLFDSAIFSLLETSIVSDEVSAVYKRFVSMKQEAPDSMKIIFFYNTKFCKRTIRLWKISG